MLKATTAFSFYSNLRFITNFVKFCFLMTINSTVGAYHVLGR